MGDSLGLVVYLCELYDQDVAPLVYTLKVAGTWD